MKSAVIEELNDVEGIAITADAWTSLATKSYVTVTIPYITKDWQRKSAVLDTSELDESRSAENIATRLELLQAGWNLERKMSLYTRQCLYLGSRMEVARGLGRSTLFTKLTKDFDTHILIHNIL